MKGHEKAHQKKISLNDGLQQVNLNDGAPLVSSKGHLLPLWPRQGSQWKEIRVRIQPHTCFLWCKK